MNLRLLPVQAGIIGTFLMFPAWLKLPDAPRPFTATYILGFALVLPMLWSIAAWLLMGCPGLREFLQSKWRIAWGISLLLLVVWTYYSQGWAFMRANEPGVAQSAALQATIVAGFLLVTACAAPPLRVVIVLLTFALLWNVILGGLQVAQQHSIGLAVLGEQLLDPAQSGTSVIESGGVRWLRPYGLLPHPNILAGVYIVGMMAAATSIFHDNRRVQVIGITLFLVGFWMFLLTFSRGAWIGFAVGILAILPLVLQQWRKLMPIAFFSVAAGVLFFVMYFPFILSRTGAGQHNTEMRSLADRLVFTDIAMTAIREQPLLGVGGGNFPWYASYYLYYKTDYDLRGDNVHNIYLSVWAELGLVGLVLFAAFGIFGIIGVIQNVRKSWDIGRIAILGSFVALVVVGLVDHYPWTLIQGQVMWAGLLAVGLKESTQRCKETEMYRDVEKRFNVKQ